MFYRKTPQINKSRSIFFSKNGLTPDKVDYTRASAKTQFMITIFIQSEVSTIIV